MNINMITSDFKHNVISTTLSKSEEELITKSYNNLSTLKENNLFHVVKDAILRDISLDYGRGLSLASIEKLFHKINNDMQFNPDLTLKIKKIFIDQIFEYNTILPATLEATETDHILAFLLKENPGLLFMHKSQLNILSAESQLQLVIFMANNSKFVDSIDFRILDKINTMPLETRLEIAKMIAKQGQNQAGYSGAYYLCTQQLRHMNLQNTTFEQKMDLADCILQNCQNQDSITKEMYKGLLQLQPREPKDEYLAYIKALVKKFVLGPKGIDLDLDQLTQNDFPLEKKLILAKKLASLGFLADQYIAALIPDIFDIELASLILRHKGEGSYAVLEHLESLPLKNTPVDERLEFAKLIFDVSPNRQNESDLFKIITALLSPTDTLEQRFDLAYTINESRWRQPNQSDSIIQALLKDLPPEGVPLSDIEHIIRKNNKTTSLYMMVYFHLVKCRASDKELLTLVPCILELAPNLTYYLAYHLDKFGLQSIPFEDRIDYIMKILQIDPQTRTNIANKLHVILGGIPIQERLEFARRLLELGDQGVKLVAEGSPSFKLNEASIQDRLDLAFYIARQEEVHARILLNHLNFFFLSNAPSEHLFNLAELIIKQGQNIARVNPEALDFRIFSIKQRFILIEKMIHDNHIYTFDKAWLADMPWEYRLNLAKQAIKKSKDRNEYFSGYNWDLQEVPFSELYSYAEQFMQHMESVARNFSQNFLALFGHDLKETEIISLLRLFSRQSAYLLKLAISQLTSPPLKEATCRQAIMEFLVDTDLDLQTLFNHPALQEIKPILYLLTMKTLDVQEAVNQTNELPKDVMLATEQLHQFLTTREQFKILLDFYSEIDSLKNPILQFKLMRWLAYTTGKFADAPPDNIQLLTKQTTMHEIYKQQSLPNRFVLIRELCHRTEPFQPRIITNQDNTLREFNEYGKLSWILLSQLKSLGISFIQFEKINDLIDGKKGFKATKNFSILVDLLNEVLLLPPLNVAEAKLFCDRLETILSLKTMDHVLQNLENMTNTLILLGRESFIKALTAKDLNAFFFNMIEKQITIGETENFTRKWKETFGNPRNPNAIFIYLRSLEKLPLEEREIAKKGLSRYIQSVLNGDFPAIRYQTKNQPHLEKIFANEELKNRWLNKGKSIEIGNYTLSFSDDFMDLLLIGTEIQGSCMHIGEDPRNNKALISSLMHGGVIPIIARPKGTADSKMTARCFLRLGWDNDKQTAVLLQESIYSNVKDAVLSNAMNQMAVDKAKQLGIPLIEKDRYRGLHGKPYEGTFSFLGGDYPYVYSDAARGLVDGLKGFDIKNCYYASS